MKDGRFHVIGISGLQRRHLLLERDAMRVRVLPIFTIDLGQRIEVRFFARSGLRIRLSYFLTFAEGRAPSRGVSVLPKPVIVRHGNAPIGDGTG